MSIKGLGMKEKLLDAKCGNNSKNKIKMTKYIYINKGKPKGFSIAKYMMLNILCGIASLVDGIIIIGSFGLLKSDFSLIAERKYLDSIEKFYYKRRK